MWPRLDSAFCGQLVWALSDSFHDAIRYTCKTHYLVVRPSSDDGRSLQLQQQASPLVGGPTVWSVHS